MTLKKVGWVMLPIFLSMLETPEEKQLFTELYEANRRLMLSVAMKILRDEHLAEDAVNQAFMKLISNFKTCEENSRNQTKNYWVIISRSAAIDIYNERRKIAEIPLDEAHDLNDRYEEDTFASKVDFDHLIETIDKLPEMYCDILYLSYILGFSVKEIASMLDISISAVKQRLMRARQKLSALLEGMARREERLYQQ